MPEWLEILLKVGPLVAAAGIGLLQLYLGDKFSKFKDDVDSKLDKLEVKIEAKYPARDIVDLLVGGLKDRLERLEEKNGITPKRRR